MAYRRRTLEMQANQIEAVLAQHKVAGHVRGGTVTPRFVRFEIVTEMGAKISKVTSLADEIALALDKRQARIFREGGSIQVEVPRSQSDPVRLLPLCGQLRQVPGVTAVLGLEQTGAPLLLRLASPDVAHVLIVGTTGSGKTALARTLLASLAMYNRQSQVQLVLIDPKGRGFAALAALPHTLGGVVSTAEAAIERLRWLVMEMERRDREQISRPALIVAVDELADLLQSGGAAVEAMLTRLAQRGPRGGHSPRRLHAEANRRPDRRRHEGELSHSPGRGGCQQGRGALCQRHHRLRRRKAGRQRRLPAGQQGRYGAFSGGLDRQHRFPPGGRRHLCGPLRCQRLACAMPDRRRPSQVQRLSTRAVDDQTNWRMQGYFTGEAARDDAGDRQIGSSQRLWRKLERLLAPKDAF